MGNGCFPKKKGDIFVELPKKKKRIENGLHKPLIKKQIFSRKKVDKLKNPESKNIFNQIKERINRKNENFTKKNSLNDFIKSIEKINTKIQKNNKNNQIKLEKILNTKINKSRESNIKQRSLNIRSKFTDLSTLTNCKGTAEYLNVK